MNVIFVHGLNHWYEAYFWPWLTEFCTGLGLNIVKPEFPCQIRNNEVYYKDWARIMDEKIKGVDLSDTMVIAHSMGSVFSVKYFTERGLNFDTFIALAGSTKPRWPLFRRQIKTFVPEKAGTCYDFSKMAKHRYALYSISDDDNYFATEHLVKYADRINAVHVPIENAGHFRSDTVCKNQLTEIITSVVKSKNCGKEKCYGTD
ncbi:MAG: alpha/beta hydrolase [Firmicutes bacterium]|nr:alpha/beta hydrolase [Bacillota bacterium]